MLIHRYFLLSTFLLMSCMSFVHTCSRRRPCPPKDKTRPKVFCPQDIDVIADPYQTNAFVTWNENEIKAIDDRDGEIAKSKIRRCGPGPNQRFSRGPKVDITYYTYDRAGNKGSCKFSVKVTVVHCDKPLGITNGYFVYHPAHDYRYGGDLTYGCFKGYVLEGTAKRKCEQHNRKGYWSDQRTPKCEKIRCNELLNLKTIPNGDISCTDSNKYQSKCTYTCNTGYRITQGQSRVRVCSYRGLWLGTEPSCQDVERPIIHGCPKSEIFYTVRNKNEATPNWFHPTASDNSRENIIVKLAKGFEPLKWTAVGTHNIIYTAEDNAKNQARPCSFYVIVRRLACHTIYPTPYLQVSCQNGYGFGRKCSFACDTGKHLIGHTSASCEVRGQQPPISNWDWGVEMPRCEGRKCDALPAPQNGALACDIWLYGEYCKMFCEKQYDVPMLAAERYSKHMFVCKGNGEWNRKTVPACSETRRPGNYNMGAIAHYFHGDCCGNQTQLEIQQNFISLLNSSIFSSACQNNWEKCDMQNVEVICGSPSQCTQGKRKKRTMELTIKGVLTVTPDQNSSFNYAEASNVLESMAKTAENTLATNSLPDSSFTGFKASVAKIDCEKGTKPSYNSYSCVPCENGYTFDDNGDCKACPIGYYQDGTGDFDCTQCPADKTTAQTATQTAGECIDMCPEGSFSTYGTEPCSPCPTGSYTDVKGSNSCARCPHGTTTDIEGSASYHDCQSCKFVFVPAENSSYSVSSQITGSTISSMTISMKLFLPEESLSVDPFLKIADDSGNQIVSFSIGTSYDLVIKGCNYHLTGSFQTDNWNSLLIEISNSALPKVYLNRKVATYQTKCSSSNFQITTNKLYTTLQSSEELNNTFSLMELNIWHNTKLDASTINNASSTCNSPNFGNTMSWTNVIQQFSEACTIPAECDVSDDCSGNPCGNSSDHTCIDKVNDYTCLCLTGFTGRNCETNIDDCVHNICENNATCEDGVDSYICHCEGYRGEFCEIEIVNGGWSEWSDWSHCSESCDNGTKSRQRTCDQPSPDSDGLPCEGEALEVTDCFLEICKSCVDLSPPENGYVNCTYDPESDMTNCTASCVSGFAFSVAPLEMYSCGYLSNYNWSADDSSFVLPPCTEIEAPKKVSAIHSVTYQNDIKCTTDSKQQLTNIIHNNTQNIKCVQSGQCEVTRIDIKCPTQKRSTTALSFVLILSMTGLSGSQPVTGDQVFPVLSGSAQALYNAASTLYSQIAAGNFTVPTPFGTHFILGQQVEPEIICHRTGYTWIDYFCLPCQNGYFEENYICKQCPVGTYNSHHGQNICTKCPPGLTTGETGSTSQTDCNVPEEVSTAIAPGVNGDPENESIKYGETNVPVAAIVVPSTIIPLIVSIIFAIFIIKKCKTTTHRTEPEIKRNYFFENPEEEEDVNLRSIANKLPPLNTLQPAETWDKRSRLHSNFGNNKNNTWDLMQGNAGAPWKENVVRNITSASEKKVNLKPSSRPVFCLPQNSLIYSDDEEVQENQHNDNRPQSARSITASIMSNCDNEQLDSAIAPLQ